MDLESLAERRSRKGAWIEIVTYGYHRACYESRSRKGAWIEMDVAPMVATKIQRRSRKGAWIEIVRFSVALVMLKVAPVRERGLK